MTAKMTLAEAGRQEFHTIIPNERYRLVMPGVMLTLEADRLRWDHGELSGQLAVFLNLEGVPSVDGRAESSSMNFSSLSARTTRAKALALLTKTPDYPWAEILQLFCLRLLAAFEQGDPPVDLKDVEVQTASNTTEVVLGLPILRYDPMMVVAKGGSGKSLLVLKILGDLSARGYRCGYVDSEWNEFVHRDRLGKLYGDDLPSVLYLRLQRSLELEADRVRRFVCDQGLDFVALDSVGMGVETGVEGSEAANKYLRAVRSLGRIGTILVSHVKHDGADGSESKRPVGSVYWINGCRSVWFLKSAQVSPSTYEVALEQVKANHGRSPMVALKFEFGERVRIESIEAGELTELADSWPIRERIATVLRRRGAMTLDDLAEELGENRESVKKAVNRQKRQFTKTTSSDGKVTRIGLLERRSA